MSTYLKIKAKTLTARQFEQENLNFKNERAIRTNLSTRMSQSYKKIEFIHNDISKIRPQTDSATSTFSLLKIPEHRKAYRPINRKRKIFNEYSQVNRSACTALEESTPSFKYSNKFQRNPSLFYDKYRKEYSYIQSETATKTRIFEETRNYIIPITLRPKYKCLKD